MDFFAQLYAFSTTGVGIFIAFVFTIIGVGALFATLYQVVVVARAAGFKPFRAFRSIWTLPIVIIASWLPFGPPWWAALLVILAWLFVHWVHDRETTETALTAIGRIITDVGEMLFDAARGAFASPAAATSPPQNAALGAGAPVNAGAPMPVLKMPVVNMPGPGSVSLMVRLTALLAVVALVLGLGGWLISSLIGKGEAKAEARHETAIANANTRSEQGRADFNSDLARQTDQHFRRDAAIREEADRGRDEIAAAPDAAGKLAAYRAAVERMRHAADAAHATAVADFVSSVGA